MPADVTLARARRHLARRDPVLAPIVKQVGPCLLRQGTHDHLFDGLLRAIISQQLSARAAETIHRRVCALAGADGRADPRAIAALPPEALRGAGLSTRKAEYVIDLARRVGDGLLHLDALAALGDEEAMTELTAIRGIGRWTAEMVLIFLLHRLDILPLDDVGLQRAVQRAYRLPRKPSPAHLTRIAEPWRPWRSVARWYLWRWLDALPPAGAG
jgi:DNA-3-methyladenine glycosylase II